MTEIASRITAGPERFDGRPCVRNLSIRVSDVLALLAAGHSPAAVVATLPDLELADVAACLRFSSRRLGPSVEAYDDARLEEFREAADLTASQVADVRSTWGT